MQNLANSVGRAVPSPPRRVEDNAPYQALQLPLAFLVDGEQRDFICGETDWTNAVFYVQGSGEHVMKWRFNRDGEGSAGDDCAWVANMTVKPAFELAFSSGEADTGMPPDSIFACEGDMVTLPGQGSLDLSGSHFVGWGVGESIYSSGTRFAVGTNDLAFIAKWDDRTFGEYMNCPYRTFVTSGEAEWIRAQDCSADGLSLRSGAISHSQTSRLENQYDIQRCRRWATRLDLDVCQGWRWQW